MLKFRVWEASILPNRDVPEAAYSSDLLAPRRVGYGQMLPGHAGLNLLASVRES